MEKKIIERIQALLNKAASTDSEAEANSLSEKVQELLLKYNLEMADIEGHDGKGPRGYIRSNVNMSEFTNKNESSWAYDLLYHLTEFNLCQVVLLKSRTGLDNIAVLGRPENVQVVLNLHSYLVKTIQRLRLESWKQYIGDTKKNAYARSFYRGCVLKLFYRLKEKYEEQLERPEVTALVRLNDTALEEFTNREFSSLKQSRDKKRELQGDGFNEGFARGGSISLNQQLNKGNHQLGN